MHERQFPPSAAPANLRRRHQSPASRESLHRLSAPAPEDHHGDAAQSASLAHVTLLSDALPAPATTPVAGQCFPPYSQAAVA